ncbi:MAG: hypothetical protein C0408_06300, partial [Odoribacter sp.]|nr:hypothetical protein [Odoribacter sp.]
MGRTLLTVIMLLFSACSLYARKDGRAVDLTFVLTSPSLSNDSSVFICGNIPQLADWNPAAIKMKNTGDHIWSLTVRTD